jgi:predicted porin
MTYGVQLDIELVNHNRTEESGPASNSEEASMYVGGDFGTVHFGHDDNAYGRYLTYAPTSENAISQEDTIYSHKRITTDKNLVQMPSSVVIAPSAGGQGSAFNDSAKLTYISPNFSGFEFGVSAADSDQDEVNNKSTSYGAKYTVELDGGNTLGLTGGSHSNNANDQSAVNDLQYGITYGIGSFTLTASQYEGDDKAVETKTIEYGLGYKINDAVSLGYSLASAETSGGTDTPYMPDDPTTADVNEERAGSYSSNVEGTFQSITGQYVFAPGLKTTLAWNTSDITATADDGTHENAATEMVLQLEFSF